MKNACASLWLIDNFTLEFVQSTYVIRDIPKFTIKGEVIDLAIAEEVYQNQYLQKNGIQYRHYFGPNGPRAPPLLHMWPANHVGQVHQVESSHGFWLA